jgi:hypothetical protein
LSRSVHELQLEAATAIGRAGFSRSRASVAAATCNAFFPHSGRRVAQHVWPSGGVALSSGRRFVPVTFDRILQTRELMPWFTASANPRQTFIHDSSAVAAGSMKRRLRSTQLMVVMEDENKNTFLYEGGAWVPHERTIAEFRRIAWPGKCRGPRMTQTAVLAGAGG